jgi:hypothetical protein
LSDSVGIVEKKNAKVCCRVLLMDKLLLNH